MKLVRYGAPGREKPGLIDTQGKIRDLSKVVPDIAGAALSPSSLNKLRKLKAEKLPLVRAIRASVPASARSAISSPSDSTTPTMPPRPACRSRRSRSSSTRQCPASAARTTTPLFPKDSTKLDWEVELGIVIGSRARYLSLDKALDVVAGYCLANDVSERVFQIERGGQWTKGKGCETFGPLGPWLVTKDEIKDPQNLAMWLDVNGEKRQRGNTSTMIFDCRHIVWACSQYFVMEPGDVIITGTPPGVGLGMKPEPKFFKAGDVVTLGVDGVGEQRQKVVKGKY